MSESVLSQNKFGLQIGPTIEKELPGIVKSGLSKMSPDMQALFEDSYKDRRADPVLRLLLAIFFPIQFILEGRIGLFVLFFLSCIVFIGFVWWFIDVFLVYKRTQSLNRDLAVTILRDIKITNE